MHDSAGVERALQAEREQQSQGSEAAASSAGASMSGNVAQPLPTVETIGELQRRVTALEQLTAVQQITIRQLLEIVGGDKKLDLTADQILNLFEAEPEPATRISSPLLQVLIGGSARDFAIKKYAASIHTIGTQTFKAFVGLELLHIAARKGTIKFFQWLDGQGLLDKGASDNLLEFRESNFTNKATPLALAAQAGQEVVACLLIARGADVYSKDCNTINMSVLDWALHVPLGSTSTVPTGAYLLQCGATCHYFKPEGDLYTKMLDQAFLNIKAALLDNKPFAPYECGWLKNPALRDKVAQFICETYLVDTKPVAASSEHVVRSTSSSTAASAAVVDVAEGARLEVKGEAPAASSPSTVQARISYLLAQFGAEVIDLLSNDYLLGLFAVQVDPTNPTPPLRDILAKAAEKPLNDFTSKKRKLAPITSGSRSLDYDGSNLVVAAAIKGNVAFFQWLKSKSFLEKESPLYLFSPQNSKGYKTTLICAVRFVHKLVVQFLMEHGAEVNSSFRSRNVSDKNVYTALEYLLLKHEGSSAITEIGAYLLQCGAVCRPEYDLERLQACQTLAVQTIVTAIKERRQLPPHEMGWTAHDSPLRQEVVRVLQTDYLDVSVIQRTMAVTSAASAEAKASEASSLPPHLIAFQARLQYVQETLSFVDVARCKSKALLAALTEPSDVAALLLRTGFLLTTEDEQSLTPESRARYEQAVLLALVAISKILATRTALTPEEVAFIKHANTQALLKKYLEGHDGIERLMTDFGPQGCYHALQLPERFVGEDKAKLIGVVEFLSDLYARLAQQNLFVRESSISQKKIAQRLRQMSLDAMAAAFLDGGARTDALPKYITLLALVRDAQVPIHKMIELPSGIKLAFYRPKPVWFHLCVNNQREALLALLQQLSSRAVPMGKLTNYLFRTSSADLIDGQPMSQRCSHLTPLVLAVLCGHKELVVDLIARGAILQHKVTGNILYWACMSGRADMIKLLLIQGAVPRIDSVNSWLEKEARLLENSVEQLLVRRVRRFFNKKEPDDLDAFAPAEEKLSAAEVKAMQQRILTQFLVIAKGADIAAIAQVRTRVDMLEAAINEAGAASDYASKSPLTRFIIGDLSQYKAEDWTSKRTFTFLSRKSKSFAQELRELVVAKRKEVDEIIKALPEDQRAEELSGGQRAAAPPPLMFVLVQ